MLTWQLKHFKELSGTELYAIMRVRQEVFIVEQTCPYLDADGKDIYCQHLIGYADGDIAAYARIVPPHVSYNEPSIGRVITTVKYRTGGYGKEGNADVFQSPLVGLDNALLTPHIGGSTLEAQDNIGLEVAAKLIRYSDNGSTLSAVNFPEVTLPEHTGSKRLMHIHRNVPGILSQINDIFSREGVNIDGQFLRTHPKVGYVVIDITASEDQADGLREQLAAIEGTLKVRILY